MRHLLGLVLGILLAPALLLGTGWAYPRALEAAGGTLGPLSNQALGAYGALLGAGLVLGLIIASRVSPLIPVLPGLAMLGWTGALLALGTRALELPSWALPAGDVTQGVTTLLQGGVYAMLGLALLIPLFQPSRWRRREHDDAFATDDEVLV
ncbi:MAG: hypothetical protein GEV11_08785 [Streptosporangiales bacterium]|nr:hypothetical protein [Streptosporangiales bacterium]